MKRRERILLRVDVEFDDVDESVSVRLLCGHVHLGRCASCLSMMSLRVAKAFYDACDEIAEAQANDEPPASGPHVIH